MMKKLSRFVLGLAAGAAMSVSTAMAAPTITFSLSTGLQPSNVGIITLTQLTDAVNVNVDLLAGYGFINTGGPHTPFAFNLANDSGVSVTFNTPAGGTYAAGTFTYNAAGGGATPFGTFSEAIDSSAGNGSGNGYFADLDFTVFKSGITLSDFIANATAPGYYFAADLSDGKNTGSQGWAVGVPCAPTAPGCCLPGTPGCGGGGNVPEPETLAIFASGLVALGVATRRRRKKA